MGLEAIAGAADSTEIQQVSIAGAAKASVAVSPPMTTDAGLRLICEAWPTLPNAIKAGVLAMVDVASGARNEVG